MIHKSFTKKDIIEIIQTYDIPIDDPKQFNKSELSDAFIETLEDFEISWSSDLPTLYDNKQLLEYLSEQKCNEELNYQEKTEMIQKAKKIINYCRNGFMISFTHCDIPTCRRAIDEFNKDPKIRNKIEKKISPKIKKTLEQKKINKEDLKPKYKFKKGHYEIRFD